VNNIPQEIALEQTQEIKIEDIPKIEKEVVEEAMIEKKQIPLSFDQVVDFQSQSPF
jgi:hypothetical protein